jgi:hypothetical protein
MLDKTKGNTKLENRVMKHRITILFFIYLFFFSKWEHSAPCVEQQEENLIVLRLRQ